MELDSRMMRIADCVTRGGILADIGTDHGKLPVYLAKEGVIKSGVASDINAKPLEKARNNIIQNGLEDKLDTCLTDGLKGVERFMPTDVVIAGMGGELISKILEESTVDKNGVRFILQPMTKEDTLRTYLCSNGYLIYDEHLVEEGKLYQIICAEYTGQQSNLTQAEALLGKINIERGGQLLEKLANKVIKRLKTRISGKKTAGLDFTEEEDVLRTVVGIKEKCYEECK